MAIRKATVFLRSVSPYLANPMSPETLEGLRTKKKTAKAAGSEKTVREECESQVPRDPEGNIAIPLDNVIACLVAAGRSDSCKLGKAKLSTVETTQLYGLIEFEPGQEFVQLTDFTGNPNPEWVPDQRRGVGKQAQTPTAVCVTRPKFNEWAFAISFTYDDRVIDRSILHNLFRDAGRNQGLGGFRPNKGRGRFGRFQIKMWKEVAAPDRTDEIEVVLDGQPVAPAAAFRGVEKPAKATKASKKKAVEDGGNGTPVATETAATTAGEPAATAAAGG